MKVVLDANVYISALISNRGYPKQILDLWKKDAFELLTTKETINELKRALRYPKIAKLHKLTDAALNELISLLHEESQVVVPLERLHVSADETDNRYIECAVAGNADYLVTGDKKHLLPIGSYQSVKIVSPATFFTLLQLEG